MPFDHMIISISVSRPMVVWLNGHVTIEPIACMQCMVGVNQGDISYMIKCRTGMRAGSRL